MNPQRANSVPVPDPTALSTEALNREIGHLRELMNARFTEQKQSSDDWQMLINEKFKGVDRTFEEFSVRSQQRFDAQTKALDAAFLSAQMAVAAALTAAEKAVTKAEVAAEKRFDSAMEFQKAVSASVQEQMPRKEAETRFETMSDKFDNRFKDMAMKIDDLKASRDTVAGKSGGVSASWAVGVVAVSLAISVGSFLILLMNKS